LINKKIVFLQQLFFQHKNTIYIMRCIIIDDEAPARNIVKSFLQDFSDIELINEYSNGFDGFKAIVEERPDLIFLDIQMPKLNGFEMLEILSEKPIVVFTTAFDQYAIKAFENNAVDYLLKPFSKTRFREAIEKAKNEFEKKEEQSEKLQQLSQSIADSKDFIDRVIVKTGTKINIIPLEEIMYIKAEDDYVMIHSSKGKYLKQGTMKYYEAHLPQNTFVRIHRSYILNITTIDKMDRYEKETYIITLKNGETLKTSKNGAKVLKRVLNM
jgi:two-component system, LytTR family, response regulator